LDWEGSKNGFEVLAAIDAEDSALKKHECSFFREILGVSEGAAMAFSRY
jgi:hypothetical protein